MPATRVLTITAVAAAALVVLSSCSASSAPTATSAPPATSAPRVAATQPAAASMATSAAATPATATAAPTSAAQAPATTQAGAASPTPAGSSSGAARFTGIPWAVGQSASYTMTSGSTTSFTYALVGKEGSDWWMETKVQQTGQPYAIAKMLMAGPSTGTTQVKRMIIQQQGQPAYELPAQYMQQGQQPITPTEAKINQAILGSEAKTVRAGTFANATHAKYTEGNTTTDGYFHSTVPITGMVYVTVTSSNQPPTTLELLSFKMSGATTEITGPAGSFPGS